MTNRSAIPNASQTQHLVLLVGSNPLPNYVAGQLLCPTGQIYLVHSTATKEHAEKLSDKFGLQRCPRCNLRDLGKDESNPQKIYQKVQTLLVDEIPAGQTVGLHYTGGTKVMSVHAYEAARQSGRPVVCSYLDARTLSMVIVGQHGQQDIWTAAEIEITVEDIIDLHRIALQQPPKKLPKLVRMRQGVVDKTATKILLENVLPVLVKIQQDDDSRDQWREWCNSGLRRADEARSWIKDGDSHRWQEIVEKGFKWKSKGNLKLTELPSQERFSELIQVLKDEFKEVEKLTLGNLSDLCGFPSKGKEEKMEDFAKWFDGEWLEDYTLWTLQALMAEEGQNKNKLHEPGMDYKREHPEFQFDVAVTRSYQLYAFSCTTSDDKKLCKSKLFEAYIRARQMGGDEAKTALVCCYGDADALEQEMAQEFDAKGRIKVFGRAELPCFKKNLEAWFDQVDVSQRSER